MLPNDDFKAEVVSGKPTGFILPQNCKSSIVFHGPLSGWGTPNSYDVLNVANVGFTVDSRQGLFVSDTAYEITITQDQVYDFGLLYNLVIQDTFLARRIHLYGFIQQLASGDRCNFEYFLVSESNPFELVVHVLDDLGRLVDLSTMSDFLWQLRDLTGAVQVSKQYSVDRYVDLSDGLVHLLLEQDDLTGLSGTYEHEAQIVFDNGLLYTLFHGKCEFIRIKD